MKCIIFSLCFLLAFATSMFGQTCLIGDKIGPATTTSLKLLGTDASAFYAIRIDQEKKERYGFVEGYSISDMKRVLHTPINLSEIAPDLEDVKGTYYCNAGVSLFYTTYDSKANLKTLMAAICDIKVAGKWKVQKLVEVNSGSKNSIEFYIQQNKDHSFLIGVQTEGLKTSPRTYKPTIQLVYLDGNLDEKFSKAIVFDMKRGTINSMYLSADHNIYTMYTRYSMNRISEEVMCNYVNTITGESKTFSIWNYDRQNLKRDEINANSILVKEDLNKNIWIVSVYHSHMDATQNSKGLAIVKIGAGGNFLSAQSIPWPNDKAKGFDMKDGYLVFMNINKIDVTNDDLLRINTSCQFDEYMPYSDGQRRNGPAFDLKIKDGKILSYNQAKKAISVDVKTLAEYSGEIYLSLLDRTYCFYNQSYETFKKSKDKDFWVDTYSTFCIFESDGSAKEEDLNLKIGGDNTCQLLPAQSIYLNESQCITLAVGEANLYIVKIKAE